MSAIAVLWYYLGRSLAILRTAPMHRCCEAVMRGIFGDHVLGFESRERSRAGLDAIWLVTFPLLPLIYGILV